MKSKFNLFKNTSHLTNSKEDHLTEFLVALLLSSPSFRMGYEKLVLSRFFEEQHRLSPKDGWLDAHIVDADTQCQYDKEKRRPDVILTLSNGKKVACEHKTESVETGRDEDKNPNQLWDYLHLPDISGLVYIRSNWKPPQQRVVEHPCYVKPADSQHFLWRDFYHLLLEDKTALGCWMKEAFEYLSFTPPIAIIGEMWGPDKAESKRNRENYKKLLANTYGLAHRLGWKAESASIESLWCRDNPRSTSAQVMISAGNSTRFLVRVTPKEGQFESVRARLTTVRQEIADRLGIPTELDEATALRAGKRQVHVLLLTTTLREILGKAKTLPEVEDRLTAFYGEVLTALQEE